MAKSEQERRVDIIAKHGVSRGLARIIVKQAARFDELPLSVLLGVCQQESGFENVFGHDPTIYSGAGKVTKAKYLAYRRESHRVDKQQGIGVTQPTARTFQDRADELGGCWTMTAQVQVAAELLARLIAKHGRRRGLASYNGGETGWRNGLDYADKVLAHAAVWHKRLT